MIDELAVDVVVLDIDDTLYLERDYVESGFSAVGDFVERISGLAGFGERCQLLFQSGVRGNVFDLALRDLSASIDVSTLVEIYRSHQPSIALAPDAAAFLDAPHGKPLAVITDGPSVSQWNKVRALDLDRWCEVVVVTADFGSSWGKPSLLPFRHLEQRLGASGSQLVYIADNPAKDFVAPHLLGWKAVRVRRPGSLHEAVPTPEHVHDVRSFSAITLV